MTERSYYVYILASRRGVLYVGITNSLERRMAEHRSGETPGFTKRYNVTRLAYWEEYADVTVAIAREKQIKGWSRAKKIALIKAQNPTLAARIPRSHAFITSKRSR
ncbi:MAG: GIY-YIG nuclease family protein [Candidatus Binataceae bacterium]